MTLVPALSKAVASACRIDAPRPMEVLEAHMSEFDRIGISGKRRQDSTRTSNVEPAEQEA